MEPVTGAALITGGAGLLGSAFNLFQQDRINQRMMEAAKTAHQTEVKDLRAAGLNPILSAGGGGSEIPSLQAPRMDVDGTMNSALAAMNAKADIAVKAATAANQTSAAAVNEKNARMMDDSREAMLQKLWADLDSVRTQTSRNAVERTGIERLQAGIEEQLKKLRNETESSGYQLEKDKAEAEFYKATGPASQWINMIKQILK